MLFHKLSNFQFFFHINLLLFIYFLSYSSHSIRDINMLHIHKQLAFLIKIFKNFILAVLIWLSVFDLLWICAQFKYLIQFLNWITDLIFIVSLQKIVLYQNIFLAERTSHYFTFHIALLNEFVFIDFFLAGELTYWLKFLIWIIYLT